MLFKDFRFEEFKKYIEAQKKRDVKVFKRVEERYNSSLLEDKAFCKKASDVCASLSSYAFNMSQILKAAVDNFWGEVYFDKKFNQAVVIGVLKDEEFIAFLIQACLIRRISKLNYDSKGDLKLRLYWAILCFDEYKKNKWCE